jgi:hypothetical protein
MTVTSAPTALDTQDLRGRLRRRLTWMTTAYVLTTLLAVVSAVVLLAVDKHLSAEQATFHRYPAEINWIDGGDGDDSSGTAHLDFVQDGHTRWAHVHIDDSGSFSVGPATALVDPHDPRFVTLPGENYFPAGVGLAFLLVGGFGACAIGFGIAAACARRTRDVLASSTWETVRGYATRVPNNNSAFWVLYLPDHEGGSFWKFTRHIPTPVFTGSVAIDGRGRLVHRVADGRRLAYASRQGPFTTWTPQVVSSSNRSGDSFEFRYFVLDEEHQCTLAFVGLDHATAAALVDATTIDVLAGPAETAVVRVPSLGIVGLGRAGRTRKPRWRERWRPGGGSGR